MTMPKPVDPVPAATMLLLRDVPEFQVLMVKRHHQIDFASGALVFPGGKPSVGDEILEWADHCRGWSTFDATQRTLRIAAIREAIIVTAARLRIHVILKAAKRWSEASANFLTSFARPVCTCASISSAYSQGG